MRLTKTLFLVGLLFAPSLARAEQQPTSLDVLIPTSNPIFAFTPVVTASAASSKVFKAAKGNFYSAYATNLTGTAGFLVILNLAAVPGDGAITPLACAPLPASGSVSITTLPGAYNFDTGITAVVTSASTCFTKTTGVITAFISGVVQ